MAWYDPLLLYVAVALDMAGPAVLLLLLRRWTRRWWAAVAGVVVAVPLAAFCLTGGVAWAATYLRVVVRGDTSVPDEIGLTVPQYLGRTFGVCGAYGVMFAGSGFGLSLPLLVLWRLAHPASFRRLARCGSAGPPAAPDAEPGAAADPARKAGPGG